MEWRAPISLGTIFFLMEILLNQQKRVCSLETIDCTDDQLGSCMSK